MKLNALLLTRCVTVYGFPAFEGLEKMGNKEGYPAVLSTMAPGIMMGKGIDTYYTPIIPRNTIFKTSYEIVWADLDVVAIRVSKAEDITPDDEVIIASRHAGTIAILSKMYPNNVVMASVLPEDIEGKRVVGTLPPTLVRYAAAYAAATIKDFNYAKDGDLAGEELKERLIITDPIMVSVMDVLDETVQ